MVVVPKDRFPVAVEGGPNLVHAVREADDEIAICGLRLVPKPIYRVDPSDVSSTDLLCKGCWV